MGEIRVGEDRGPLDRRAPGRYDFIHAMSGFARRPAP